MLHSVQRCHMLLLTCRSHLWAIKIDGNINTITFNRKNTEIVDRFAMPGNALLQLSCKSFRSSSLDRKIYNFLQDYLHCKLASSGCSSFWRGNHISHSNLHIGICWLKRANEWGQTLRVSFWNHMHAISGWKVNEGARKINLG